MTGRKLVDFICIEIGSVVISVVVVSMHRRGPAPFPRDSSAQDKPNPITAKRGCTRLQECYLYLQYYRKLEIAATKVCKAVYII